MYGHTHCTGNWVAGVCTLCMYKLFNIYHSLQAAAIASYNF